MENSVIDPSLPLEDQSLIQESDLPPPLPSRQVRFYPDHPTGPPRTPPQLTDHHNSDGDHQDTVGWQVDGSMDNDITGFQATFTMKECEEQISSLKKENFSLKLRIYFMEERLGLLHAPKDQENLHKVNIDLKVTLEEIKKDNEGKQTLLSQAASALSSQENKYQAKLIDLNNKLREETEQRIASDRELEKVRMERDQNPKISDESKLLYTEAFGSLNLGRTPEVETDGQPQDDDYQWETQVNQLSEMVAEKNIFIHDLQTQNERLNEKIDKIVFEKTELLDRFELMVKDKSELESTVAHQLEEINTNNKSVKDKEYVIKDCNSYINSLTEQLNERGDKVQELMENIQNVSQIQCKDEEIATLQAELAIHHDQADRIHSLETELNNHENCFQRMHALETEIKNRENCDKRMHALETEHNNHENCDKRIHDLETELNNHNNCKERLNTLQTELNDHDNCDQKLGHLEVNIKALNVEVAKCKNDNYAMNKQLIGCNDHISSLKQDLSKRNSEVLGFVHKLKEIKETLKAKSKVDFAINTDVFDIDSDLSCDDGFENILEQSKNMIEKLFVDNIKKSRMLLDNTVNEKEIEDRRQLDERCHELETILSSKHLIIAELGRTIEVTENENKDLKSFVYSKKEELKILEGKYVSAEKANKENKDKSNKALTAIQGFVKENLRLKNVIKSTESEKGMKSKRNSDHNLVTENESLREQLASVGHQFLESESKAALMKKGIDKARARFEVRLGEYRQMFDKLLAAWKISNDACGLMRIRLEELADFLQQMLDMQGNNSSILDLSAACFSIDLMDSLQKSIDESRLLSASVLQTQNSILEDMDNEGLDEVDQEEWTVPDVEVSIFELSESVVTEETVSKAEYDALLLELRDNLRLRRQAEEALEEQKSVNTRKSSSRSRQASEQRQSRSSSTPALGGTSTKNGVQECGNERLSLVDMKKMEDIEDEGWSEPDKEESRRRMGINTSDGSSSLSVATKLETHHTTDDDVNVLGDGLATELRRERGKVKRLQNDLLVSKNKFDRCEGQFSAVKGENFVLENRVLQIEERYKDILRKEEEKSAEETKMFEIKCNQMIKHYQELKEEVEKWKQEFGGKKEECDEAHIKVTELALQIKALEDQYDEIIKENQEMQNKADELQQQNNQNSAEEVNKVKVELKKRKTIIKDLKNINSKLEERCENLEMIINQNYAKMIDLEEKMGTLNIEIDWKNKKIASQDENLATAEDLVMELNDSKKVIETELKLAEEHLVNKSLKIEALVEQFETYKKSFNEEIVQNRVNEVETKMRDHTKSMKKLADQLLNIEHQYQELENDNDFLTRECSTKDKSIEEFQLDINTLTSNILKKEQNVGEHIKTIENLRLHVNKLEKVNELKQSLETEQIKSLNDLQSEKETIKNLSEKIVHLEKGKKLAEERCISAEKVLRSLSADSSFVAELKENNSRKSTNLSKLELESELELKENNSRKSTNLSKLELESAVLTSRPSSRRQGLSKLDTNSNSRMSTTNLQTPTSDVAPCSCSLQDELNKVCFERDAALAKLVSTRSTLASTAEKLSSSNRRKKEVEKAICKQLTKTQDVLKRTKNNLEDFCEK